MAATLKMLLVLVALPLLICKKQQIKVKDVMRAYHLGGQAQGTTWIVTYFANDSLVLQSEVDSILRSLDSSLSVYKPFSTISAFNRNARGMVMDAHLQHVVERALDVWHNTKGLSDITVAPLVGAWGFGPNKNNTLPDNDELERLLQCVGSRYLLVQGDSLLKKKPCVQIDVNGIAQGYSVDVIAAFLEKKSIGNYLVEIGGEVRVKGRKQPASQPFKIGIESPSSDDFSEPPMQLIIALPDGAITTSGNYRKYYENKGQNITHIIHPQTGRPLHNNLISATVFAKDAITADGYDNALLLMGLDSAMAFIESRKDMAAFFIYKKENGIIADTATSLFMPLIADTAEQRVY